MPSHLIHLSHIVGWLPQNLVVDFRPDTSRTHSATAPAVIQIIQANQASNSEKLFMMTRISSSETDWFFLRSPLGKTDSGWIIYKIISLPSESHWTKWLGFRDTTCLWFYKINYSGVLWTRMQCEFILESAIQTEWPTWNRLNKFAPWVTPSRKPRKPSAV